MATTTPRLGLHMPADDGSEPINVAVDLNDNLEKLDSVAGFVPSTSATQPTGIFDGMATYETDTGRAKFRKGLAGAWNYLLSAGAVFLSDIWLNIGQKIGIGTTTPTAAVEIVVDNVFTSSNVLKFRQTGHANPVVQIDRDGMRFGAGGASATDVRLYRPAANQLGIQGSVSMNSGLDVTGTTSVDDLTVSNNINIGGSVSGDLNVVGNLTVAGIGMYDVRLKSSDTSRANTAAPTPDTAFDYALEANTTYLIELFLMVGGDPAGDFRCFWISPAGVTGPRHTLAMASAQTTTSSTTMITTVNSIANTAVSGLQGVSNFTGHHEMLVITTTGTTGTLQFCWAQGTSSATATTVKAGSIMRVRKVA